MPLFIVIYDFDPSDRPTGDALIGAMRSLRVDWRKFTDSVYLIEYPSTALAVRDALQRYFRAHPGNAFVATDRLLVAKLTGETAWSSAISDVTEDWLLEKAARALVPSSSR